MSVLLHCAEAKKKKRNSSLISTCQELLPLRTDCLTVEVSTIFRVLASRSWATVASTVSHSRAAHMPNLVFWCKNQGSAFFFNLFFFNWVHSSKQIQTNAFRNDLKPISIIVSCLLSRVWWFICKLNQNMRFWDGGGGLSEHAEAHFRHLCVGCQGYRMKWNKALFNSYLFMGRISCAGPPAEGNWRLSFSSIVSTLKTLRRLGWIFWVIIVLTVLLAPLLFQGENETGGIKLVFMSIMKLLLLICQTLHQAVEIVYDL